MLKQRRSRSEPAKLTTQCQASPDRPWEQFAIALLGDKLSCRNINAYASKQVSKAIALLDTGDKQARHGRSNIIRRLIPSRVAAGTA